MKLARMKELLKEAEIPLHKMKLKALEQKRLETTDKHELAKIDRQIEKKRAYRDKMQAERRKGYRPSRRREYSGDWDDRPIRLPSGRILDPTLDREEFRQYVMSRR